METKYQDLNLDLYRMNTTALQKNLKMKIMIQHMKIMNNIFMEEITSIDTFHAKLKVVTLNKLKNTLLNSKATKDLNRNDTIKSYNNLDDDRII